MPHPVDLRHLELSEPLYVITANEQGVQVQKSTNPDHKPLYSLDQILAIVESRLPQGYVLQIGGAQ